MSLVGRLLDIQTGDIIVLRREECEAVGFVVNPRADEVDLMLEDPISYERFKEKDLKTASRGRRKLINAGVVIPSPTGRQLEGLEKMPYPLSPWNGYQKLVHDGNRSTYPDLTGRLSGLESSVVMISNPDLRVVGFVENVSQTNVSLARHYFYSGHEQGHLNNVLYNLREFNQFQVLRPRPA